MKKVALLLALPALAFTSLNNDTAGPYTDSHGNVWTSLPKLSDYASAAEFDAAIGHEVFTTRNGDQFQVDRELTPSEFAAATAMQAITRAAQPTGGSGAFIQAIVTTNHPVDEEYRGAFGTVAALRSHVISEVNFCDAALNSNWGIDMVPSSGQAWDSNDFADIGGLLDEAFSEHGYNGKDMMVALSNDYTSGGAIGIAYLGSPRQLVKKYGTFEAEIMQHETGHNYTLYHCCDNGCIMLSYLVTSNMGSFHNYNESCSGQNHWGTMNSQRNRY